ncbi:hypothetical protein DERP_007362 [Dermatophagoides pteronyssinus]|uniref:Uncharacterized protein n=1 Tax=Dermatophagoides pteronyssinus TaxID=6956 RepID=A0ABQ8J461_DERPT|nr:hypothetical protein DERP_007362 [Dermatophagoides pteronyssinus]
MTQIKKNLTIFKSNIEKIGSIDLVNIGKNGSSSKSATTQSIINLETNDFFWGLKIHQVHLINQSINQN